MSADGQNGAKCNHSNNWSVKLSPYIAEKVYSYGRNNKFICIVKLPLLAIVQHTVEIQKADKHLGLQRIA